MADAAAETTKEPKKKKALLARLIVPLMGTALAGVGFGAGLFSAGSVFAEHGDAKSGHGEDSHADADKPQLVKREGSDKYETTYFEFPEDITSNLSEPGRYVQVGLGIATNYDHNVIENLERHEVAVRSEVLKVLADESPAEVSTVEGKAGLQDRLTTAINAVLEKREDFGGIDEVYFTKFIVQ
jgi:flagellar protein FliL